MAKPDRVAACPWCAAPCALTPVVQQLCVCANCQRSLVVEPTGVRLARAADTAVLTDAELAQIRGVRTRLRVPRPVSGGTGTVLTRRGKGPHA